VPRTKNLQFGTGVICLPNHHPVVVAAEAAQFDHMSQGRFMLGVGPGGLLSDFELFGHSDVAVRNRKVVEAIRIMRQIWSQDPPYDIEGEFWNVRLKDAVIPELGIGYMPKPFQKGGPPISISLASPHSSYRAHGGAERLGHPVGQYHPDLFGGFALGDLQQSLRRGWASVPPARIGAWRATSWWRRPMRKPTTASSARRPPTAICLTYVRTVLGGSDCCRHEAAAGHAGQGGNRRGDHRRLHLVRLAKTMLDKLVAFREEVGPFGHFS
jgi:hypothetical protein